MFSDFAVVFCCSHGTKVVSDAGSVAWHST